MVHEGISHITFSIVSLLRLLLLKSCDFSYDSTLIALGFHDGIITNWFIENDNLAPYPRCQQNKKNK